MSDKQRQQRIEALQKQLAALVAANAPVGERYRIIQLLEEARG